MTEPSEYRLLSVVVPVYNEHATVGEVVRRIKAVELPGDLELEIVVVDDGSTDGTDKVLTAIEDSTVKVVRHTSNQGKGAALRTGIENTRGELILTRDADLEYSSDDLPSVLAPLLDGRAKIVFGSRIHPDRQTMPLTRMLSIRALSIVTDVLFNTTLADVKSPYRLYDAEIIRAIEITDDGFSAEAEILGKLLRSGHRIYEVPISYRQPENEANQKFTSQDNLHLFKTILKYRFTKAS